MSRNARAARACARAAHDAADLRHLLHALGLLDDDGQLRPDDNAPHPLTRIDRAGTYLEPRPHRWKDPT